MRQLRIVLLLAGPLFGWSCSDAVLVSVLASALNNHICT